jgi:hypothetical protein
MIGKMRKVEKGENQMWGKYIDDYAQKTVAAIPSTLYSECVCVVPHAFIGVADILSIMWSSGSVSWSGGVWSHRNMGGVGVYSFEFAFPSG